MASRTQRTAHGLTILNAQHPRIRQLKREGETPQLHGNKFWNSSFLVMKHLQRHPLPRGARVLEIGCGWGLLSIYCAKAFAARVHGIDADAAVLPYLALHADVNDVAVTSARMTFEDLRVEDLAAFDVILGADICFWDDMTRQLYNLVRRARRAQVSKIIIADPCRSPFTALANRCEDRLERVQRTMISMKRPVQASGELLILS